MKTMKRLLCIALAAMLALGALALTSCEKEKDNYTIGICQLVQHDALDAATKGFKDAVIAGLGEDKVTFDEQNAANSTDTCATITSNFVTKNVDLIMANATPALQAAYAATETIPILGTSVTEYGVALGIEDFSGTVGSNVSGTSDLAPLDKQAQMIIDLTSPSKVALLYCSAEANSKYQVKEVKSYLEAKSIECKEFPFSDANDVQQIAANAADWADAIYVPTDNTAASCSEAIWGAIADKKVPVIAGEEGICKGTGLATLSINYYDLGYATGEMAVKILKGEGKIEEMAIEYTPEEKLTKKYNKAICEELGFDPAELEAQGYVAIQ